LKSNEWLLHQDAKGVVGFEAQHDHGGCIRRAGKAESVGVFDTQAIDGDDFPGIGEVCGGAQLIKQHEGLAFGHLDVELRGAGRVGQRLEHGVGSVARDRISSRRAPAYRPSSKPYQRSLKKMWPLISPASGAPVSLSLALTSAWPVFHIVGLPPLARSTGPEAGAFDVVDDLAARNAAEHVGGEQHQLAVGEDDLAVLGDHAEAVAVAVEGQADLGVGVRSARITSCRFSGLDGSGWWLGKVPSTSQNSSTTSQPIGGTGRGDAAGDAVAAVDDDLHRARQLYVADDAPM
jgi:hypothetical protein